MLKFIIVTLCIFFIFRFFARMFVVTSFNSLNKKMQDEVRRRQHPAQSQNMPEGHITIDPGVKKQQKNNNDDDYVDYEEVK
jgi:hypothetical protein